MSYFSDRLTLTFISKLASGSRYTQPDAYANDYIELIRIRNDAYAGKNRPYIFGVDDHPNGDWMAEFLKTLRKNGHDIDAYTWHDYPLGQGKEGGSLTLKVYQKIENFVHETLKRIQKLIER